jgi:hypothetical protein
MQRRINIPIQKQLAPRSAWLSLRYVNPCSVLTSQDRHEARYPNVRDFTTHLSSSVFLETHRGSQLATREIEYETMRVLRPGGVAMNWIDQDELIKNADELASRREDPLVTAVQAGAPEAFAQLYAIYSPRLYRTITAITKNPERCPRRPTGDIPASASEGPRFRGQIQYLFLVEPDRDQLCPYDPAQAAYPSRSAV